MDLVPEKQSAMENRFEQGVFGRGEGAQEGGQRQRGKWNKAAGGGAEKESALKQLQDAFPSPLDAPAFLRDTDVDSKTTNDYFPQNSNRNLEYTGLDSLPQTPQSQGHIGEGS